MSDRASNLSSLYNAKRAVDASAGGQIIAEGTRGVLQGVLVVAGDDAASAMLYNGTDASGTLIAAVTAAANEAAHFTLPVGVEFTDGIFVVVTGTAATVTLYASHTS